VIIKRADPSNNVSKGSKALDYFRTKHPMSYDTIELTLADGVASVALNRPDRLNSFNEKMHEELRAALDLLKDDGSIRCMVLTGRGRGFCAGQDLSERAVAPSGESPDLGASLQQNYNPLVRHLRALSIPVIAAVNGVAAGAGADIALACDIVIATRSAKFVFPFARLGLVPDCGGTWILPRLIGRARAMGLATLGESLTAEQAEQWGLIWKCLADEEFQTEIDALARHLATQPTFGLSLLKQAMNASPDNSMEQQLDLERDLQRRAGRSHDYQEGVAAFMEKREPVFTGK